MWPLRTARAGISILIVGATLMSNVAGVYASEGNFWQERNNAARRRACSPLLAQLPGAPPSIPSSIEVIPALTHAPNEVPPALRSLPANVAKQMGWLPELVAPYGEIREIHLSPQPNAPLIVHLQDVHEVVEAQQNLAGMVEAFHAKRGVSLVGLEGAVGPFDLEPYRSGSVPEITRELADTFLKLGYLTGPEVAGIVAEKVPTLWGIEDLPLYRDHIQAFEKSEETRSEVRSVLQRLSTSADEARIKLYPPLLRAMDDHRLAYQAHREPMGDYVSALWDCLKERRDSYPNIALFVKALTVERALDFKEVERERLTLVNVLTQRLSPQALDQIVRFSLSYRAGRLAYGDYQRYLLSLCQKNHVRLESFGPLNKYISYVLMSERIDPNGLLQEMDDLERTVLTSLAKTDDQRRLVEVRRDLALLDKLTLHSLAPGEWEIFKKEKPFILNIPHTLSALVGHPVSSIDGLLTESPSSYEMFCERALDRNTALVQNLLAKMRMDKINSALLVAGGFHSEGIAGLFRKEGLSYVVVTPRISKLPENARPLDIFVRAPLPLEKMLAGDVINLAYPRLTQVSQEVIATEKHALERERTLLKAWRIRSDAVLRKGSSWSISGNNKKENNWFLTTVNEKLLLALAHIRNTESGWFKDNPGKTLPESRKRLFIAYCLIGLALIFLMVLAPEHAVSLFQVSGPTGISGELMAGFFAGGMTLTDHPTRIKMIGEDDPLDPAHDGEKAYTLGVLSKMGVNIPPGFALLPSFYETDFKRTKSLARAWENVLEALRRLERKTGQVFGNEQNPIFLSIRSNAGEEESMPGLMKTITSVGLNQNTFRGLVERDGEWFALDTMRRFIRSYATAVFNIPDEEFYLSSTDLLLRHEVSGEGELPSEGLSVLVERYRSIVRAHGREIPEDVNEQLKDSLKAVLMSFDSEHARIYKKVRGLNGVGMGAIVQKMVFGNLDDRSGSGVVFTRNRNTGKNELDGQYGIRIQGEAVVSGRNTPRLKNVELLKAEMPHAYDYLINLKNLVENRFGWPQDIEFTIQKEELFILQTRNAEMSPEALLQAGNEMVEEGIIPSSVFMAKRAVMMAHTKMLYHLRKDFKGKKVMKGKYGTPGAVRGRMMFSDRFNPGSFSGDPIVIVEINPSAPAILNVLFSPNVCGLLTVREEGVSHAAIRCQSSGMPSVMGISGISREGDVLHLSKGGQIREGDWIVVDGDSRSVFLADETDVLVPSRLVRDASLRLEEVKGIEEQVKKRWGNALYEEVLEEYADASKNLERIKERFPSISQSELDTANVRLHALHLIAWEKGADQGYTHGRVNRDIVTMKQAVMKAAFLEDAIREGEATIVLLEDSSMVDRSGEKNPDLNRAKVLFAGKIAQNRKRAEEQRMENYSGYPSHEILLNKETRHHDGGGVRFYTHIIYVNVPLEIVEGERAKGSFSVEAQNMKYQNIVEGLEAGSPYIEYDGVHHRHKHSYVNGIVNIQWWPKTEGQDDTHLSFAIKIPSGQILTITERGNFTTVQFENQPVNKLPLSGLRSLFMLEDTVYLVVSPDLLQLLVDNEIPRIYSDGGGGGDSSFVRIVNSTVAPVIKKNFHERRAKHYLKKDAPPLQEFKKTFWDPLMSELDVEQCQALIKLTLAYEIRSCLHTMPPFLILNHELFRKAVPEISPERGDDKLYLEGVTGDIKRAIKMEELETRGLLALFHDPSTPSPQMNSLYYSSLADLFLAFERAGAVLPEKLKSMLVFLSRSKYSPPWDNDGLFRIAAGLLPDEIKPVPPSPVKGAEGNEPKGEASNLAEALTDTPTPGANIPTSPVKGNPEKIDLTPGEAELTHGDREGAIYRGGVLPDVAVKIEPILVDFQDSGLMSRTLLGGPAASLQVGHLNADVESIRALVHGERLRAQAARESLEHALSHWDMRGSDGYLSEPAVLQAGQALGRHVRQAEQTAEGPSPMARRLVLTALVSFGEELAGESLEKWNHLANIFAQGFNENLYEGREEVLSSVRSRRRLMMEVSETLLSGKPTEEDQTRLAEWAVLANHVEEIREDQLEWVLPNETSTLGDLMETHPVLAPLLERNAKRWVKTNFLGEHGKYSVKKLLLESQGKAEVSGLSPVDLYLVNRDEWDLESDLPDGVARILISIVGGLVYDVTVKTGADLKRLYYLSINA